MAPKRTGDEVVERNGRADDAPVVAHALHAAVGGHPEKKDEEKLSIYWRVFGGTVLSIVALVAVTLYNNVTTNISELRAEVNRANEARATAAAELRAELARANETRADLVRKDEFSARMTSNWDRVQALQQQNNAQNATLTSLKTELDGVKERFAAATGDFKASRDDIQKLKQEAERNQAYDHERRDRRDTQYKQIDETLKELAKGLQDCREKLARLEGQYTPVGPPAPAPKKATAPRATPAKADGKPEVAPPRISTAAGAPR